MKSPIFIFGAHKSGTSLVRSLFDGHPELVVIPIETHFFEFRARWVDYRLRRTLPRDRSRDDFVRAVKKWIRRANARVNPEADSVTAGMFAVNDFDRAIETVEKEQDDRIWFEAYVSAIYRSLHGGELPEEKRVVEKSVENAEFAVELREMWPEARFVHVIRNPYAALLSIRRFKGKGGMPWLGSALRSLYNSYYWADRNVRVLDGYTVVRYEDLVNDPQPVVEGIAERVEVEFRESMLQPSSVGRDWSGNSTTGQDFDGISAERVGAWRDSITAFEASLVNRHLQHVVNMYNYDQYWPSRSPYWPHSGETPRIYLGNRALLHIG